MKIPENLKNVIDVTKSPYFADNTGKTDCTYALCRIFDDILQREIDGIELLKSKLTKNKGVAAKVGFESRYLDDSVCVIFPEKTPASRIIYFPAGIYLISDTVSYTLKNLQNIISNQPFSEMCRGIHIVGESKATVTIKLVDNCKGFEYGNIKPIISFNRSPEALIKQTTNVAQMNTIRDITIDCGDNNDGAVGILQQSSNSGRVENVRIISSGAKKAGFCGIMFLFSSECCVRNVEIDGFDYGMTLLKTSLQIHDHVVLKNQRKDGILLKSSLYVGMNIEFDGKGKAISSIEKDGLITVLNSPKLRQEQIVVSDKCFYTENIDPFEENNDKKYSSKFTIKQEDTPENVYIDMPDCVCVDDFGAVGDGHTDCSDAIQNALNSGHKCILFGEGQYFVDKEIYIPATVKYINFMFCDFINGEYLRNMNDGGLFVISEDSEETLFLENVYTFEQLYGFMRFIKHSAKRNLVMKDIHTQTAGMYFNTIGGSKVWLDNCACTTGSFAFDNILSWPGVEPVYAKVLPFEFHNQKVWARNLNPERAEIEVLNDASELWIAGLKVEGAGTAVKTINGGRTEILIFTAGIGNTKLRIPLFINDRSSISLVCGRANGSHENHLYSVIAKEVRNNGVQIIEDKDMVSDQSLMVTFPEYSSNC